MVEGDILEALRDSYREVLARKKLIRRINFGSRTETISDLRRYLRYFMDLLDIYLDIQRDRRWRRQDREDW